MLYPCTMMYQSIPELLNCSLLQSNINCTEIYWWCACGKSKSQPFCDGSHKGSQFKPLQYTATETRTLWFCICKKTGNQPLCDGSHSK